MIRLAALFLLAASASAQVPLAADEVPRMSLPSDEVPPAAGPAVSVRVSADGSVLMDGVASDAAEITAAVRELVRKRPDGGVTISVARGAPYDRYVQVLDAIKDVYTAERGAAAQRMFGTPYDELSDVERDHVQKVVPLRITLAEPEATE